jgi:hypothetical protein
VQFDEYSLSEAVDVLSQITPAFYEGLNSAKWRERLEQLEVLAKVANTPKISSGDYAPLILALKKVG